MTGFDLQNGQPNERAGVKHGAAVGSFTFLELVFHIAAVAAMGALIPVSSNLPRPTEMRALCCA